MCERRQPQAGLKGSVGRMVFLQQLQDHAPPWASIQAGAETCGHRSVGRVCEWLRGKCPHQQRQGGFTTLRVPRRRATKGPEGAHLQGLPQHELANRDRIIEGGTRGGRPSSDKRE